MSEVLVYVTRRAVQEYARLLSVDDVTAAHGAIEALSAVLLGVDAELIRVAYERLVVVNDRIAAATREGE